MKKIALIIMGVLLTVCGISQTTITLQPGPSAGKDAFLTSGQPAFNYGTYPSIIASAWSNGGDVIITTSLFQFNLSTIPAGSVIADARLSLYKDPNAMQEGHAGDNMCYLRRVVNNWSENLVTYNYQPMTTVVHQMILPSSKTPDQDYLNINVTELVTDMVNDPSHSFGFYLQLVNEQRFRSMVFASSDNWDAAKRPKLVVTYYTGCDTIKGTLSYSGNAALPLQNFKVILKNENNVITDSTHTNALGKFAFRVCNPGTYKVIPLGPKPQNGINSSDALIVLKHFTGIISLENLYLLAADVDHNGSVNAADGVTILNRFIGRTKEFAAGDWVFDTQEITLPLVSPVDLNIKGLCVGDLNASWRQ